MWKKILAFIVLLFILPLIPQFYTGTPVNAADVVNVTVAVDTVSPEASNETPANLTYINYATPIISINITDALTGVNVDTINMTVNGTVVTINTTAIIDGYHVENTTTTPFPKEQVVNVTVEAYDNAPEPNKMTFNWSFTIDTIDPIVTIDPVTTPTNVSTQTIAGNFTETNIDKIVVKLVFQDASVTETEATLNKIAETYDALVVFVEDGTYNITATAIDNATNTNTSTTIIVYDATSPSVVNETPAANTYTDNTTPTISVDITDALSGVNENTIKMVVEEINVTAETDITPITGGYHVEYTPTTPFAEGQVVNVAIEALDNATNSMAYDWSFMIGTLDAEIKFSISTTSLYQYENIEFSVTVNNTGDFSISPSGWVNISDSSNTIIATLELDPPGTAIQPGSDYTTTAGWNTGSNAIGTYTANVTMYYDGKSVSSTDTFSIVSPPPPPAVGGGISPPIIPPLEVLLKFIQLPVLQEVRPGETVRTKIFIHNPTADDFGELIARISIAGVPEDWVTILPEILSLGSKESKVLDIILTIPADARAGDYKVGIDISNKRIEAENFFILRVNPHPPGYDKPSVTRIVNIDKSRGNTLISLEVKNAGNFVEEVEIIEEIPKELAQTADQIEFSIPPTEILEADPVVKWVIEDLQPYETRTISYRVPVILDEYSAYVYWPVKQTSIIYEKPPELIEVSRISTPELFPGTTEEISIGLRNLDTKPVNLTAKLELPANWGITPDKIVTTIPPRDSSTLSFLVTPPSQAAAGTHTMTLRISYDGREFTVDSTAIVKHPSWIHRFLTYLLELVLALTIIVVVVFIILILRGKFMERGRRRGGVSLLKLKQEMKKR